MRKNLRLMAVLLFAVVISGGAYAETVRIASFEGDVNVTASGSDAAEACQPGATLTPGATIVTGTGSWAEIAFDLEASNIIRLKENSTAVLGTGGADKLELRSGEAFVSLGNLQKGEVFRVRTPHALCGARGTAWVVRVSDAGTRIWVLNGKVLVRGLTREGLPMDGELLLDKGHGTNVRRFERPIKYSVIPPEEAALLEKENSVPVRSSIQEKAEEPVPTEKPAEDVKTGLTTDTSVKPAVDIIRKEEPAESPSEPPLAEEQGTATPEEAGMKEEAVGGVTEEISSAADPATAEEEGVQDSPVSDKGPSEEIWERSGADVSGERTEDSSEKYSGGESGKDMPAEPAAK